MPVPKNCVIFIGCNFESRASQAGLQKQKKDTASAKEGKVCSLRRGGQRLKAVLLRLKTWPRATENTVQVAQPSRIVFRVATSHYVSRISWPIIIIEKLTGNACFFFLRKLKTYFNKKIKINIHKYKNTKNY